MKNKIERQQKAIRNLLTRAGNTARAAQNANDPHEKRALSLMYSTASAEWRYAVRELRILENAA